MCDLLTLVVAARPACACACTYHFTSSRGGYCSPALVSVEMRGHCSAARPPIVLCLCAVAAGRAVPRCPPALRDSIYTSFWVFPFPGPAGPQLSARGALQPRPLPPSAQRCVHRGSTGTSGYRPPLTGVGDTEVLTSTPLYDCISRLSPCVHLAFFPLFCCSSSALET